MANHALDYCQTVKVLTDALGDSSAGWLSAEELATALGREGYGLILLDEVGSTPLQHEAAANWFGTEGEQT